jgi:hypothetical protein
MKASSAPVRMVLLCAGPYISNKAIDEDFILDVFFALLRITRFSENETDSTRPVFAWSGFDAAKLLLTLAQNFDAAKACLASTMRSSQSAFRPVHRSLLFDRRGWHLV